MNKFRWCSTIVSKSYSMNTLMLYLSHIDDNMFKLPIIKEQSVCFSIEFCLSNGFVLSCDHESFDLSDLHICHSYQKWNRSQSKLIYILSIFCHMVVCTLYMLLMVFVTIKNFSSSMEIWTGDRKINRHAMTKFIMQSYSNLTSLNSSLITYRYLKKTVVSFMQLMGDISRPFSCQNRRRSVLCDLQVWLTLSVGRCVQYRDALDYIICVVNLLDVFISFWQPAAHESTACLPAINSWRFRGSLYQLFWAILGTNKRHTHIKVPLFYNLIIHWWDTEVLFKAIVNSIPDPYFGVTARSTTAKQITA